MENNRDVLLTVNDLTVEYTSDGRVIHAVNGVSFQLRRGTTLGLVGETGAGKTTTAKSILRLLPEPPARIVNGEILFEGKNLLELSPSEMQKIRGNRIAMIFQDPMTALNPTMRVGDQIAAGIKLHKGISRAAAKKEAAEMLEVVGIPKFRASEYPHQFSGGMRQRVTIAMALACSPDLLLADEPTTALDVTIQAQVLSLINDLRRKKSMSMILITHDLSVVAETCDEVAVVYAGEIIERGSLEEIFDHPAHPYTHGLFGSVPSVEEKVDRLTPIPGAMPDPANLPTGCKFHSRCSMADENCASGTVDMQHLTGTHYCRCCKSFQR